VLEAEKQHLANLLGAIQRCIYFLDASMAKINWPLQGKFLAENKKDVALFESLSAINERFAKLQDVLGSAMRHAALLSGESTDNFLKVLAFYEKNDVIESVSAWQLYRTVRNVAAHDYETDYGRVAEHFNAVQELASPLHQDALRFIRYCDESLGVQAKDEGFGLL
jgi:hypothetical protein